MTIIFKKVSITPETEKKIGSGNFLFFVYIRAS